MCFGGGNQPIDNQPVEVINNAPPPQPTPVVPVTTAPTAAEAPTNAVDPESPVIDGRARRPGETGTNRLYNSAARFGSSRRPQPSLVVRFGNSGETTGALA